MDNRFKGRIIQALRRLSFSYPPRTNVKRNARVAPSTYECNICGIYVYDGKSEKNFLKVKDEHDNTVMGKLCLDHIVPVVDSGQSFDWNNFINGLFCEESNYQCICKPCHDSKTKLENKGRVKKRKLKK